MTEPTKQDLIAQWAFDTRSLLLRFHLWLEDIEISWRPGSRAGYEAVRLHTRGNPALPGHDRGRHRARHPALRPLR